MAFTIWRALPPERIRGVLPPALRKRAGLLRGDGPFALVVFRGHDVISSREVAKALGRLPRLEAGAVVAAGPDFTAEARDLLAAHGAQVLSEDDFFWTDASYVRIRQS
jgi:hypothetical protein